MLDVDGDFLTGIPKSGLLAILIKYIATAIAIVCKRSIAILFAILNMKSSFLAILFAIISKMLQWHANVKLNSAVATGSMCSANQ